MPLWIRFLCAAATGAVCMLAGLVAAAYGRFGGPWFWPELWQFAITVPFWWLAARLWLVLGSALAVVRLIRWLRRGRPLPLAAPTAGLLAALAYGLSVLAREHLPFLAAVPDLLLLGAGGGIGTALSDWLYQRL